ncbi:MAG: hypothetical protein AAGI51_09970 [Pseudomonadota bacterium]
MTDFAERLAAEAALRTPLFSLSYEGEIAGRRGRLTHDLSEIVHSGFNAALSRHLRAVRGEALPQVEAATRFEMEGREGAPLASASFAPGPLHALERIVETALGDAVAVDAEVARPDDGSARAVKLTPDLLAGLRAARRLADAVADPAFCRIEADLEGAVLHMPGSDVPMAEIDFAASTVVFAASSPGSGEALRVPLLAAIGEAAERGAPALAARIRRLRDLQRRARAEAVAAFREAAEREIAAFADGLGGRPLEAHALEIAHELSRALREAFGDDLKGLSPHARLRAFDWASPEPARPRIMAAE